MKPSLKKSITIILNVLFIVATLAMIIVLGLAFKDNLFDDYSGLLLKCTGVYLVVSLIIVITNYHLGKEFRVKKQQLKLKDIDFRVINKFLTYDYVVKLLKESSYNQTNERVFSKKVTRNDGDSTWIDRYNIMIVKTDNIDLLFLDELEAKSSKGINVYNLVFFMINQFDEISYKHCLDYIRKWLANYRDSYLKNIKGFAIMVYEESTTKIYYYQDQSILYNRYKYSTNQLLNLIDPLDEKFKY